MVGQSRRQDPLVADRSVGEDQRRAGMAQRQFGKPVGKRWQATPGVNQDRHGSLFGEREDAVHLLAVELERLRARMQLDPARAHRKTALGLVDRVFGRIEAEYVASAGTPTQDATLNGTRRPSLSPAQPRTRSLGTR